MKSTQRFALALAIILSGLLFAPFVALPRESFRWQLFQGVYEAGPSLGSNYAEGGPGSFFLISGLGFAPNQALVVKANGRTFATIQADAEGEFRLLISTAGVGGGTYVISIDDNSAAMTTPAAVVASISLQVVTGAPVRERPAGTEGLTPLVLPNLPAGLGDEKSWLPLITR